MRCTWSNSIYCTRKHPRLWGPGSWQIWLHRTGWSHLIAPYVLVYFIYFHRFPHLHGSKNTNAIINAPHQMSSNYLREENLALKTLYNQFLLNRPWMIANSCFFFQILFSKRFDEQNRFKFTYLLKFKSSFL